MREREDAKPAAWVVATRVTRNVWPQSGGLAGEQWREARRFAAVDGRTGNRAVRVHQIENCRYFSGKMTRAATKPDDLKAGLAERQSSRLGEACNAWQFRTSGPDDAHQSAGRLLRQRSAVHATHWAPYALMMVQPFVGWVATSALFQLPPIWPADRPLSDRLFMVHALIAAAIACLGSLDIGAALYHHFVRRDGVLMRMTTG